jgi:hypothetical protein
MSSFRIVEIVTRLISRLELLSTYQEALAMSSLGLRAPLWLPKAVEREGPEGVSDAQPEGF